MPVTSRPESDAKIGTSDHQAPLARPTARQPAKPTGETSQMCETRIFTDLTGAGAIAAVSATGYGRYRYEDRRNGEQRKAAGVRKRHHPSDQW